MQFGPAGPLGYVVASLWRITSISDSSWLVRGTGYGLTAVYLIVGRYLSRMIIRYDSIYILRGVQSCEV